MRLNQYAKGAGAVAVFGAIVLAGMSLRSVRVRADDGGNEESKIREGFAIAPVMLNLVGKNREMVGLGSYIVNAVGDCNGCHSQGPPTEFLAGGNAFLLSPPFQGKPITNPATYLSGGRDFGPFVNLPHLYSRNLTPDKTGLPEGGHTLKEFIQIMRHGTDFDAVHPNCPSAKGIPPGNCLAAPFNGDLLQVMRWPSFQNMTDHDLEAIYEYLKAIPCNPGVVVAGAPYLQNVCH